MSQIRDAQDLTHRKTILQRLCTTLPQRTRDQPDTNVLVRAYVEQTAQIPRLVLARAVAISLNEDEWLTPIATLRLRAAELFADLQSLERGTPREHRGGHVNPAEVAPLLARMAQRSESGGLDVLVNADGDLEPQGWRLRQAHAAARQRDEIDGDLGQPRIAPVPWARRPLPDHDRAWRPLCAFAAAVPRTWQCARPAVCAVAPPSAAPYQPACEFHARYAHTTYGPNAGSLSGQRMAISPASQASQTIELDNTAQLVSVIEPRHDLPAADRWNAGFTSLGAALSDALGPAVAAPQAPEMPLSVDNYAPLAPGEGSG